MILFNVMILTVMFLQPKVALVGRKVRRKSTTYCHFCCSLHFLQCLCSFFRGLCVSHGATLAYTCYMQWGEQSFNSGRSENVSGWSGWEPQVGDLTTICSPELWLPLQFGDDFLVWESFSDGGSGLGFVLYSEMDLMEVSTWLEMASSGRT